MLGLHTKSAFAHLATAPSMPSFINISTGQIPFLVLLWLVGDLQGIRYLFVSAVGGNESLLPH